jgi:hypothetical protein
MSGGAVGSDRRAEAVRVAKALLLGASLGIVLIILARGQQR